MSRATSSAEAWTDKYTVEVARAIVSLVMTNRSAIYNAPALAPVANNAGDRINKKVQQILRKLVDGIPGAQDEIVREIASHIRSKSKSSSPKKPTATNSAKKRKIQAGDSSDEEKPDLESE